MLDYSVSMTKISISVSSAIQLHRIANQHCKKLWRWINIKLAKDLLPETNCCTAHSIPLHFLQVLGLFGKWKYSALGRPAFCCGSIAWLKLSKMNKRPAMSSNRRSTINNIHNVCFCTHMYIHNHTKNIWGRNAARWRSWDLQVACFWVWHLHYQSCIESAFRILQDPSGPFGTWARIALQSGAGRATLICLLWFVICVFPCFQLVLVLTQPAGGGTSTSSTSGSCPRNSWTQITGDKETLWKLCGSSSWHWNSTSPGRLGCASQSQLSLWGTPAASQSFTELHMWMLPEARRMFQSWAKTAV